MRTKSRNTRWWQHQRRCAVLSYGICLLLLGTGARVALAACTISTLDSTGDVGAYTSAAIGGDYLPVIAYYDSTNDHLKVAHCNDAACTSASLNTVGPQGGVCASMAIGGDGYPLIVYHNGLGNDLKVVHCKDFSCSTAPDVNGLLSSSNDGGCDHAVSIGSDGLPVVVYRSSADGSVLMLSHCSDAACASRDVTWSVNSGTDNGRGVSLAIGGAGFPIFSYVDAFNGRVELQYCADLICSGSPNIKSIATSGVGIGSRTALTIDDNGHPIVAYTDSSGNLKVATCSDTACSSPTVRTIASGVGNAPRIARQPGGAAVMAYRDVSAGDLRSAVCTDAACAGAAIGGVDSAGNVGEYPSLVYTTYSSGWFWKYVALFTYYDLANGDLKAAYCNLDRTFTVNSTTDAVDANLGDGVCDDGSGHCTLRAAVQEANGAPGPDTIVLPPGTFTLTIPGTGESAAATGDLNVIGDLSIVGAGAGQTVIDANSLDRALFVANSAALAIRGVTIQHGLSAESGGGIGSDFGGAIRIADSIVTGNTASLGGGICAHGPLSITNTTVSGNTGSLSGGGGIFADFSATIVGSTISGNNAIGTWGYGGGIFVAGRVTMTNSTLSGNTAATDGGGAFFWPCGSTCGDERHNLSLRNVTVAYNQAGGSGGGVANGGGAPSAGGNIDASNTLIAGNTAGGLNAPDCAGELDSGGYNLIQNATGCTISGDTTGNLTGVAANLGPLGANGGPTKTHALMAKSPALDAGNPALPGSSGAACEAVDQRAALRPTLAQGRCDIGAYEAPPPSTCKNCAVNTCGNGLVEPTDVPPNCDAGAAVVTVDENGGSVTTPDQSVTLEVPAGALWEGTTLSVSANTAALGSTFGAVDITARPRGQQFMTPVTFTFKWADRDGNHLVDVGTCDDDSTVTCDADAYCTAQGLGLCSVHVSNTAESDLVLRRNGQRFSLNGFGAGPFTCADHLAGSSACASAVANCADSPGTGHATVANCCDPVNHTWTFQTCYFSNDSAGLAFNAMVPGTGPATTDCHAEWLPNNPNNKPLLIKGITNYKQTCIDGDECDQDGIAGANGSCTFAVLVALNVPGDERLFTKNVIAPACTPIKVKRWRIISPKPDIADKKGPVGWKQAIAKGLRDKIAAVQMSVIGSEHEDTVSFLSPVDAPDQETEPTLLTVPLRNPSTDPSFCLNNPEKCKTNSLTINVQNVIAPADSTAQSICLNSSNDKKCIKDNDKLTLICQPPKKK